MAKVNYVVSIRYVTIYKSGTLQQIGHKSIKSRWYNSVRYDTRHENVVAAVKRVTQRMMDDQIGGIVVIRPVYMGRIMPDFNKIFQAKWGTDNQPFVRFDGIAGSYWANQIRNNNPELFNRIMVYSR